MRYDCVEVRAALVEEVHALEEVAVGDGAEVGGRVFRRFGLL